MAQKRDILIVCGEPSGDLNASLLARELISRDPGLTIHAVGGPMLAAAGAQVFRDIRDLSVMGLFDVLAKLPVFLKLQEEILARVRHLSPAAVVLVDFSGFNLRLAKALDNRVPVFYFVSPQVWASREGRVEVIRKYVARMLVLFRFEQEFYSRHGIDSVFVGHPLLERAHPRLSREMFYKSHHLSMYRKTVALLPGSRKTEVTRILPVMARAAAIMLSHDPEVQFIIAKPAHLPAALYQGILGPLGLAIPLVEEETYDCLAAADAAMVCSGTATLETALIGTPFTIVYRTSPLNYLLYRPQVRIPYIGMVNIVAQEKVVEEFIQHHARPRPIAEETLSLLKDAAKAARMKEAFARIKASLGEKGAAGRAAAVILGNNTP